jgi:hypothetical protein
MNLRAIAIEGGPPAEQDEVQRPIDVVIDQLERRTVTGRDRGRLSDALKRADAPLAGRAGADAAVGRAVR